MGKHNNRNPNFYDDGTRNRQGEGIVHEDQKRKFNQAKPSEGREGQANFIPGEAPVGRKSSKK
jgi:hypothetical protein